MAVVVVVVVLELHDVVVFGCLSDLQLELDLPLLLPQPVPPGPHEQRLGVRCMFSLPLLSNSLSNSLSLSVALLILIAANKTLRTLD